MAYGILKVDNITFDNGGSDQNVTVSGLYRATTSGVTLSGTIAATTVSGVTVIGSTTVSGATVTGTTANFTSGNFSNIISSAATMSGALIMANQQQVRFREAVGNGVNHIALQAPAIVSADQTITLPDQTGTVITTGDNGSVSSTMLATNLTISAAAGSASTPSIAFTGDLNTGIYSPGADQLAISTGGTGQLFVDASGNVGLGTGPTNIAGFKRIEIGKAGVSGGLLTLRSSGGAQEANISCSATGLAFTTNSYATPFDARASEIIFGTGSSGTERLRIDSSGNVGIGTTSPQNSLSTGSGAGGQLGLSIDWTGGGGPYAVAGLTADHSSGEIRHFAFTNYFPTFYSNNTERMRLTSAGLLGLGTSSPGARLQVNAPSSGRSYSSSVLDFSNIHLEGATANSTTSALTFSSGGGGGAAVAFSRGSSTDTSISFWTNSAAAVDAATERLRIDSSGRVGIGTSSPGVALDVVGGISGNAFNATNTPALFGSSGGAVLYYNGAGVGVVRAYSNAAGAAGALTFNASGSENVRIDSSGRVGIGTSSPTRILQVTSTPDTTNPSNGADFTIASPGLTPTEVNSTTAGLGVAGIGINFAGDHHFRSFWGFSIDKGAGNLSSGASNSVNADSRTFAIRQYAGGTTWDTQFCVNGSGRVGIGTSSPAHKLDVAGGVNSTGLNVTGFGGFFNAASKFGVDNNAGNTRMYSSGPDASTRGSYDFRATDSVGTLDASRMVIDSSGNVGIGTTSPSSLLHLADAGNIQVGTTTGTKIGTATTQKLGFYNATPVVQPTAVADATDAATVITQLNALLTRMRNLGLIAT